MNCDSGTFAPSGGGPCWGGYLQGGFSAGSAGAPADWQLRRADVIRTPAGRADSASSGPFAGRSASGNFKGALQGAFPALSTSFFACKVLGQEARRTGSVRGDGVFSGKRTRDGDGRRGSSSGGRAPVGTVIGRGPRRTLWENYFIWETTAFPARPGEWRARAIIRYDLERLHCGQVCANHAGALRVPHVARCGCQTGGEPRAVDLGRAIRGAPYEVYPPPLVVARRCCSATEPRRTRGGSA